MATYTTYQCSICRRTKDVLQDNVRVQLAQCNITKGCLGTLHQIGTTQTPSPVKQVLGLTEWYPRGQKIEDDETQSDDSSEISILTGDSVISLALLIPDASLVGGAPDNSCVMTINQRQTTDINYRAFLFNYTTDTTIVLGKDTNGLTLRFDQDAIDEDRVQVRVNGVIRSEGDQSDQYLIEPNIVTFNTAVTGLVQVTVFDAVLTEEQTIDFTLNSSMTPEIDNGAWSNIRWFANYNEDGTEDTTSRWWVYTANLENHLSFKGTGNQLESISISNNGARILLAAPPYESYDRELGAYVDCEVLEEDFNLTFDNENNEPFVVSDAIFEPIPPITLKTHATSVLAADTSYIVEDFTSTKVASENYQLTRTKVLGPI